VVWPELWEWIAEVVAALALLLEWIEKLLPPPPIP
jgi:hypothetical protein